MGAKKVQKETTGFEVCKADEVLEIKVTKILYDSLFLHATIRKK